VEQTTYYFFATLAAVSAAGAFVYSVFKGAGDARRSREVSARAAWEAYLDMAFENPRLARAGFDGDDADAFEQYEWFVSRMLYAAEEVLILAYQSKPWHAAIKGQIRYHAEYLRSQGRNYICHYSPQLQQLITEELGVDA
jgi:hypothetical protein